MMPLHYQETTIGHNK